VTNNHVVDGSDRVWVNFEDGNVFLAQIIGTDPDSDLAALQIDAPAGYLTPVSLGDNDDLKVGQFTFAVGNPFGETFTMTSGIVSALGRTITGAANSPYKIPSAIQTDAPINPGNSGGPLFNVHGEVIGINSQIISQSGASAGIGFAIPINIAKIVVPELIATRSHTYTYLGISGGSVTSLVAENTGLDRDTRGAIISALTAGGPAGKAGLRAPQGNSRGDIITSIDGISVRTIEDLIAYLAVNTKPGQTIVVEAIRPDGSTEKVDVLLEPRPVS
jgi:S1-C subfamily serine protease